VDVNLIELLIMCAGTGGVTGGVTLAGVRVHIRYLEKENDRHERRLNNHSARIVALERGGAS